MYWTAALEIPITQCTLCVSIYMHMCICPCIACMDVRHRRERRLLFGVGVFSCVVNSFVSSRRTACFAVANACSFIRIVLGSILNELVYKCKY